MSVAADEDEAPFRAPLEQVVLRADGRILEGRSFVTSRAFGQGIRHCGTRLYIWLVMDHLVTSHERLAPHAAAEELQHG